eukprot:COSAG02_NODE_2112_length_9802_cov_10.985159_10_plen_152_part_00
MDRWILAYARVRVNVGLLPGIVPGARARARARDIPLYGCITGNPLHPDIVGTVGTLYIKRSVLKTRSIFDSSELQTPQKRLKSTTVGPTLPPDPRGTAPRVPENRVEDRDTGHKASLCPVSGVAVKIESTTTHFLCARKLQLEILHSSLGD